MTCAFCRNNIYINRPIENNTKAVKGAMLGVSIRDQIRNKKTNKGGRRNGLLGWDEMEVLQDKTTVDGPTKWSNCSPENRREVKEDRRSGCWISGMSPLELGTISPRLTGIEKSRKGLRPEVDQIKLMRRNKKEIEIDRVCSKFLVVMIIRRKWEEMELWEWMWKRYFVSGRSALVNKFQQRHYLTLPFKNIISNTYVKVL